MSSHVAWFLPQSAVVARVGVKLGPDASTQFGAARQRHLSFSYGAGDLIILDIRSREASTCYRTCEGLPSRAEGPLPACGAHPSSNPGSIRVASGHLARHSGCRDGCPMLEVSGKYPAVGLDLLLMSTDTYGSPSSPESPPVGSWTDVHALPSGRQEGLLLYDCL